VVEVIKRDEEGEHEPIEVTVIVRGPQALSNRSMAYLLNAAFESHMQEGDGDGDKTEGAGGSEKVIELSEEDGR
jgi:hypothetical protein